jgi:benzoyl-CoA reductase subunit C
VSPTPDDPAAARARRQQIVAWARELYEDLDFTAVRRWLEAAPGRKACGYLPVYVPREVIHAAGMLPVGVHGGGSMEIIRGDAYYQSYICHIPRSVVELGLTGRLRCMSAMLFPSTCDVIRNLSGMWQVLEPGTYVRYVDLPQVNEPARAIDFWRGELAHLLHDLAALTGRTVTDQDLWDSITLYDAQRAAIEALYDARREQPWRVPSEELYLLLRAAEVVPVEEWLPVAQDYLAATAADPGRPRDNARVIVVGAFCEQPPLGLLKTIERAGCYIVDDDLLLGDRLVQGAVPRDGDPLTCLARALLFQHRESSILYEPDPTAKMRSIPRRVEAAGADGVIFAAPSFCDPALLDRPMLREGAEAAQIPCIAFKYAENTGQFQQFREQAGTFSDSIKLWLGTRAEREQSPAAGGDR